MKIISYAQNYEDVLLNRLFPDRPSGFYIDVGACHPVFHSVTKLFYERGWQGVNIEPIPSMFELLADARPRDVNLHMGLSNLEGNLPFYEVSFRGRRFDLFASLRRIRPTSLGLRVRKAIDTRHDPVARLRAVCRANDRLPQDRRREPRAGSTAGGDWVRYRPRVVLIEANRPDNWEHILSSSDYLFALFDGLNRFYVRAEDSELLPLLKVPVNLFDHFEPWEYVRPIQELRQALEAMEAQLEAARACLAPFEDLGPISIGVAPGYGAYRPDLPDWPRWSSASFVKRES